MADQSSGKTIEAYEARGVRALPSFVLDESTFDAYRQDFAAWQARELEDQAEYAALRKAEFQRLQDELVALKALSEAWDVTLEPSVPYYLRCAECGRVNGTLEPVCIWCRTRIE